MLKTLLSRPKLWLCGEISTSAASVLSTLDVLQCRGLRLLKWSLSNTQTMYSSYGCKLKGYTVRLELKNTAEKHLVMFTRYDCSGSVVSMVPMSTVRTSQVVVVNKLWDFVLFCPFSYSKSEKPQLLHLYSGHTQYWICDFVLLQMCSEGCLASLREVVFGACQLFTRAPLVRKGWKPLLCVIAQHVA